MPAINHLLRLLWRNRLAEIKNFRQYPDKVQQAQFDLLISKAKNTVFGKLHSFDQIKNIRQFQNTVPVSRYEDLRPFIDRVRSGEPDILWPSKVSWFAKSSGTTDAKSKFIPVTYDSMHHCHFQGGMDILAIYLENNHDTSLFKGKSLTLGGSHQIDALNKNARSGDLSAVLIYNMPFWAQFFKTPSSKTVLLPKWEEKLERLAREAIKQNVTSLVGVPSWNMVMIKYILEYTGKKNLLEVWPNLELFIHGGVNFIPYREQFKKMIPTASMNYLETYNASEGFIAIQDKPDSADMLLMLDYGIFYEFIPVEKLNGTNPVSYTVAEVETGKNYAMVISNNTGLWRYLIGDTVQFTSLFPHKITITGRTRHFINAFGEEVIIDNADKALKVACDKTGAIISEYTAGPVFMTDKSKGRHEWLIEFDKEPENLDYFTLILDKELMKLNSDYEAKRYNNTTLIEPLVRSILKGVFLEWLRRQNKMGGQNKVPRLSNDRKYLDELSELIVNLPLESQPGLNA